MGCWWEVLQEGLESQGDGLCDLESDLAGVSLSHIDVGLRPHSIQPYEARSRIETETPSVVGRFDLRKVVYVCSKADRQCHRQSS